MAGDAKLRSRITTLKSLNSIFSAMQVITVAKLSKVKEVHNSSKKYKAQMDAAVQMIGPADEDKKIMTGGIAAVVITGDRGLCGTFNQDVLARTQSFMTEHKGKPVKYFVFGRKGYDYLKSKKQDVADVFLSDYVDLENVALLSDKIIDAHKSGELAETYLVYNHFHTMLKRRAVANRILPLENKNEHKGLLIKEPDEAAVRETAVKMHLKAQLFAALYESQQGILSARMVTLKSAIDNSKELIDELIIKRNKSRQQMITQEILEIVEASEAMKGEANG
ncbi:MAG: F0F1 ATP synthase subunit gamma [Candidatus Margulisiibacteriota bacterium]